jgi:hypothetical protein
MQNVPQNVWVMITLMQLKVKPGKERASETERFLFEGPKKGVEPMASPQHLREI